MGIEEIEIEGMEEEEAEEEGEEEGEDIDLTIEMKGNVKTLEMARGDNGHLVESVNNGNGDFVKMEGTADCSILPKMGMQRKRTIPQKCHSRRRFRKGIWNR